MARKKSRSTSADHESLSLVDMDAAFVQLAREDSSAFCAYVMRDPSGKRFRQAALHDRWHDLLRKHKNIILWGSVECGKTQSVSVGYVAWMIGKNPRIRVVVLSKVEDLAFKIVSGITKVITSAAFAKVFPGFRLLAANAHAIRAEGYDGVNPTVQAFSYMGSLMGTRIDLLVIDDPLDGKNTRTEEMRVAMYEWYQNTLVGRLTKDAQVVMVANAWHPCLLPGSLVITARGVVPVEEVAFQDQLLVGPGQWEAPVAISKRRVLGSGAVRIKACGIADALTLTGNHRVPTERGLLEAADLRVGDCLVLDRAPLLDGVPDGTEIPDPPRARPPTMKRENKLAHTRCSIDKDDLKRSLAAGESCRSIADRYGYKDQSAVSRMVRRYGLEPKPRGYCATPGFSHSLAWWRFVGYWVAEGHVDTSTGAIRLTFGLWDDQEEREFAEDAAACARAALGPGVPTNINKRARVRCASDHAHGIVSNGPTIVVSLSCGVVSRWLLTTFGAGANGKRPAPWVEQLPMKYAREFFLGYWRGDGSLTSVNARMGSVSPSLIYGLQRWLANLGVPSTTFRCQSSRIPGSFPTYELRLSRDAARTMHLPSLSSVKYQPTMVRVEEKRVLLPIRSIEYSEHHGYVYDIQTSTGWFSVPNVRIHNSDLLHRLKKEPTWYTEKFPIWKRNPQTGEMESCWPEQWPLERIKERKRMLAARPVYFARQYECVAIDDASTAFKQEWLDKALEMGRTRRFAFTIRETDQDERFERIVIGVDLATKRPASRGKTDNSAFTVVGGKRYETGAINKGPMTYRLIWLESGAYHGPMIVKKLEDLYRRFGGIVYVEINAAQIYLSEFLKMSEMSIPVMDFETTGQNKHDADFGVEALGTEMANGYWEFPGLNQRGQEDEPPAFTRLKEGMLTYSTGSHTSDELMSLWIAREGVRLGAMGARKTTTELGRR